MKVMYTNSLSTNSFACSMDVFQKVEYLMKNKDTLLKWQEEIENLPRNLDLKTYWFSYKGKIFRDKVFGTED